MFYGLQCRIDDIIISKPSSIMCVYNEQDQNFRRNRIKKANLANVRDKDSPAQIRRHMPPCIDVPIFD